MVRRSSCLMLFALLVLGCGKIPGDSVNGIGGNGLDDLSYANDSWGFQISRPNDSWGISVQTFPLRRDPNNGLPFVDVRVASPYFDAQGTFRPELQMYPQGLTNGATLDDLVTAFEEYELKLDFGGYQLIGEKQKIKLEGGEVVQWEFRNGRTSQQNTRYPGTRFLAAVAVHNKEGYFIIANGNTDGFPAAEYRQIIASLRFSEK